MTEIQNEIRTEPQEKKKIRPGYIFLSLVPFSIMMALQTAAMLPGFILTIIEVSKTGAENDFSVLVSHFNEKYGLISYTAYGLACLAVYLPWYYKSFVKKEPKVIYKKALGIKAVGLCAALMPCFYFVVTASLTKAYDFFPNAMATYEKLVESTSLGMNIQITIVYFLILAPVVEELCFRGLMLRMLERSNIHYMLAIFIQAALFGIMHANAVQGSYAFFMGMLLGFLRYKYKTVILTTAVHMLFNILGSVIALWLQAMGMTKEMQMWAGIAGAVVAAGLLVLIILDKNTYLEEQKVTS